VLTGAVALAATALAGTPARATSPVTLDPRPAAGTALTTEQALREARSTKASVAIPGATTSTDTVVANPDGTLTQTTSAMPVRKMVGGVWQDLDATLIRDADGTVHPRSTTYRLKLSGGGSGPLATMDNAGHELAVAAPMALPSPRLSGSTATYADVLPGVDLQTRADTQGGFTHLFVIYDAAAAANWLKIEGFRAHERPQSEVTGNPSDNFVRREPGVAGLKDGVRYQVYETSDGYILFMASEREFWENFCRGIGRPEMFEANPGEQYADHAVGNVALRRELRDIFASRTTQDWIRFGVEVNTPIAPVHDAKTIVHDPQFQDRFPWLPAAEHGTDLMPSPIKFVDEGLDAPRKAPTPGQHSDEVLRELGLDDARIAALRSSGVI